MNSQTGSEGSGRDSWGSVRRDVKGDLDVSVGLEVTQVVDGGVLGVGGGAYSIEFEDVSREGLSLGQ